MNQNVQSDSTDSRVYVVDDDESMRSALCGLMRSDGLHVEVFASASEFFAHSMPDVASCLILDVRLKGQSGLAVQNQISKGGWPIPIIFITAHGDIEMSVKVRISAMVISRSGEHDQSGGWWRGQWIIVTVITIGRQRARVSFSFSSNRP